MSHSKYRAKKTSVDGITFASIREAKRYQELRLLERAGVIRNLQLQPSWTFSVDGKPVLIRSEGYPNGRKLTYRGDFGYEEVKTGEYRCEDSKGFRTPEFKIKKGLMEACHGIIVMEV